MASVWKGLSKIVPESPFKETTKAHDSLPFGHGRLTEKSAGFGWTGPQQRHAFALASARRPVKRMVRQLTSNSPFELVARLAPRFPAGAPVGVPSRSGFGAPIVGTSSIGSHSPYGVSMAEPFYGRHQWKIPRTPPKSYRHCVSPIRKSPALTSANAF